MSRASISPQQGASLTLRRGERLTIIDPLGQQVADLFCFRAADRTDGLSSGRSIDYNDTIRFTVGHVLYSNAGVPLLRIIEDTCGRHDFLVTPCSLQMFQMMSGTTSYHPSCHENLVRALGPHQIAPHQITTTFNIFMNIAMTPDGRISVEPPTSIAGDHLTLVALDDLIVGLTACSDEGTNAGSCKPIAYEIGPPRREAYVAPPNG